PPSTCKNSSRPTARRRPRTSVRTSCDSGWPRRSINCPRISATSSSSATCVRNRWTTSRRSFPRPTGPWPACYSAAGDGSANSCRTCYEKPMIGPRNLSDTDLDNLDERLSEAALMFERSVEDGRALTLPQLQALLPGLPAADLREIVAGQVQMG